MSDALTWYLNYYAPVVIVAALFLYGWRWQKKNQRQIFQNQAELISLQRGTLAALEDIKTALKTGTR